MIAAQKINSIARYKRQVVYRNLGLQGQRKLFNARALIVGVGGLGSWTAELLAKAGIGFLRIVDPDTVDLTNIHRQALYDESDAHQSLLKVDAASQRLKKINSTVRVETAATNIQTDNIHTLACDVDIILDGTDNFTTRFIINDYCVKHRLPWIFAGVIGGEGQVMSIVPGTTCCLRCLIDSPPLPCHDPNCRQSGVIGPAVAVIAGMQSSEAVKILAGKTYQINPHLIKIDCWTNTIRQLNMADLKNDKKCPCCYLHEYEFLEP